jgi:hypothetical protein
VNTPISADCQLRPADSADSYGAVGVTVDLNWFRESRLPGFPTDVEYIRSAGFSFEIYEVDDAFGIDASLGLNAIVRGAQQMDLGSGGGSVGEGRNEGHSSTAKKRHKDKNR